MKTISYAQNFEDVLLLRALGHIDKGYYIDIGAQDPTVDSVSRAFYELGWRGVHIEPTREYAEQLKQERPGDEVKQVAVGKAAGQLTLFEIAHTGLSTGNPGIADQYKRGGSDVRETTVSMVTLDELLNAHSDHPVHWLKIDVEGMESEVIAGWVSSSVRPWLVVVESTHPGSEEETYQEWEPDLLAKGYRQVYFDGINRFYLSSEHPELAQAFETPPNVFDRFVLSGMASHSFCEQVRHETWLAEEKGAEFARQAYQANTRLARLEPELERLREKNKEMQKQLEQSRVMDLEQELHSASQRLAELTTQYDSVCSELQAVYRSRSWRLTSPVRAVTGLRRSNGRLALGLKQRWHLWFNKGVYRIVHTVGGSPRLKQVGLRLLRACPPLFRMVRVRFHQGALAHSDNGTVGKTEFGSEHLTPRQRHLKAQLLSSTRNHGDKG